MTLEKLLIFGAGIAVVAALATSAATVADNREPQYSTYKGDVTDLIEISK
ncbi:MAG: hypothetical protein AAFP98_12305 [Pseudomonadota bacterium]